MEEEEVVVKNPNLDLADLTFQLTWVTEQKEEVQKQILQIITEKKWHHYLRV